MSQLHAWSCTQLCNQHEPLAFCQLTTIKRSKLHKSYIKPQENPGERKRFNMRGHFKFCSLVIWGYVQIWAAFCCTPGYSCPFFLFYPMQKATPKDRQPSGTVLGMLWGTASGIGNLQKWKTLPSASRNAFSTRCNVWLSGYFSIFPESSWIKRRVIN